MVESVGQADVPPDGAIRRLADRVAAIDLPGPRAASSRWAPIVTCAPMSSRERVIAAATELFTTRGYAATSTADIGAAAGMAGPSIYHHFEGKAQLLEEIIRTATRAVEAITLEPAGDADQILHGYVRRTFGEPLLFLVTESELHHLPSHRAAVYGERPAAALRDWAKTVKRARRCGTHEALAAVHAVVRVTANLPRLSRLRERPSLADDVIAVGQALLSP